MRLLLQGGDSVLISSRRKKTYLEMMASQKETGTVEQSPVLANPQAARLAAMRKEKAHQEGARMVAEAAPPSPPPKNDDAALEQITDVPSATTSGYRPFIRKYKLLCKQVDRPVKTVAQLKANTRFPNAFHLRVQVIGTRSDVDEAITRACARCPAQECVISHSTLYPFVDTFHSEISIGSSCTHCGESDAAFRVHINLNVVDAAKDVFVVPVPDAEAVRPFATSDLSRLLV